IRRRPLQEAALAAVQQGRRARGSGRAHPQDPRPIALAAAVVQSLRHRRARYRAGQQGGGAGTGENEGEKMSLRQARTLVVKVGSSLVTNEGRGLDAAAIARWAAQVAELRRLGKRILLVSSGAIAEGMQRLGWARRPHAMHQLQAAAAVGQ